MIESTLTAKGQTTIPKAVREKLRLNPGDRIRYEFEGDIVRLVALKPSRRLAGVLSIDGEAKTLEEMELGIIRGATDS